MEDGSLPYRAATFMGVDGMAHAPVWLQEVMSKDVVVFLLELERLRTADPRSMWRSLAEFR